MTVGEFKKILDCFDDDMPIAGVSDDIIEFEKGKNNNLGEIIDVVEQECFYEDDRFHGEMKAAVIILADNENGFCIFDEDEARK